MNWKTWIYETQFIEPELEKAIPFDDKDNFDIDSNADKSEKGKSWEHEKK